MTTEYVFVALDTYGRELVSDPTTHKRVPALKCTRAVPDILLKLFREYARDLTPPRSTSYRYIVLDPMPTLKKSYLVLRLTPDEVTQVETLCKTQVFPWVYRWREGKWWEFPGRDDQDYRPVRQGSGTSYPHFPATAAPIYVPSRLHAEPPELVQTGGVSLEASGGSWWIGGDTYPHRETLRAVGAKWVKARQQWHYSGTTLPSVITALTQISEVTAGGGQQELPEPGSDPAPVLINAPSALSERLYSLLRDAFGSYFGEREVAYPAVESNTRKLAAELAACAEQRVSLLDFWETPVLVEQLRAQLKILLDDSHAALNSARLAHLTERIIGLLRTDSNSLATTSTPLAANLSSISTTPISVSEGDELQVPDTLSNVLAASPASSPSQSCKAPVEVMSLPAPAPADLLRALPLRYLGHVSVVGDCFCFGLAVEYTPETHRAYPVYLNLCGAATSVEAAWAKLAQGKELGVTPLERHASTIYLHPPEKGLYVRIQRKLEGLGMDNLILLHRQLAQPAFTDADLTFLLAPDESLACARLVDTVRQMVKVAVFPAWGGYLRTQGYRAGLLTPRQAYEGLPFWTVRIDPVGWTQTIAEGLRKEVISLP